MCSLKKRRKKKTQQCISEARGQSIPKHLFQNSSALVAASWLPTVATAAFLSHRARGALSFQGGSFKRWKVPESCKEIGEEQQTLLVEPTITGLSSEAQEDPALHCSKLTLSLGDLLNPARRHTPLPLLQLPQGKRNLVTTGMDNSQAPLNTHTTLRQKQSFTTRETTTSLLLLPKPL